MQKSRRDFISALGQSALVAHTWPWLNVGKLASLGIGASAFSACGEADQADLEFVANLGLEPSELMPFLGGIQEKAWWLKGNYAPITEEIDVEDLEVIGQLPPELNGTLLRNGSNPKHEDPLFWFFGDGMIHGIHFEKGKAKRYHNRWANTPASRDEAHGLGAHRANTSLVYHHQKLLALYEVSPPFELSPNTLESMDFYDFGGALESPMCAHPKIDPVTGELWFIGVQQVPAQLTVSMVDAEGTLQKQESMPLSGMYFMHDFQLTENYVVLFEFPLMINLDILSGGDPFKWSPELGARIGLMPRTGSLNETQWFNVEPGATFHSFNAYEEGDEVVIESCRILPKEGDDFFTRGDLPQAWQWRINLMNQQVQEAQIHELPCEFPMIDRRLQGQKHRFNYGLMLSPASPDYPMHPKGIYKHDRELGQVDHWSLGEAVQPDEALFIPASPNAGEDEGWLISVVYNRQSAKSEVLVFNAQKLAKGPIARVLLPTRVPFGFHGLWLNRA